MTATWQNAFDRGACTVTVTDLATNPITTLHSATMAKGDTVDFTPAGAAYASLSPLTIAVDATGRVTLSAFGDPTSSGAEFAVDVAPSDMTGVIGGRLADVEFGSGAWISARRDGAPAEAGFA